MLTATQVRCIACILAAVWICSLRRAECAQCHADDATHGEEPRTRPRCWQSSVGVHPSLSAVPSLMLVRPEQLVLPDDPSFLPEFALAPPAHLADFDLDLDFLITHSGESQSLTPFGSQSSSQASALGGLVLPTSSPDQPGGFELVGDDGLAGRSGLLGADDLIQLEEPDFTFDIDGNYVEGPPSKVAAGTPAAQRSTGIHSDAGASARVRREHQEGHDDGNQVSFAAVFHVFCVSLSLRCPAFGACWPHSSPSHCLTYHLTWPSEVFQSLFKPVISTRIHTVLGSPLYPYLSLFSLVHHPTFDNPSWSLTSTSFLAITWTSIYPSSETNCQRARPSRLLVSITVAIHQKLFSPHRQRRHPCVASLEHLVLWL